MSKDENFPKPPAAAFWYALVFATRVQGSTGTEDGSKILSGAKAVVLLRLETLCGSPRPQRYQPVCRSA